MSELQQDKDKDEPGVLALIAAVALVIGLVVGGLVVYLTAGGSGAEAGEAVGGGGDCGRSAVVHVTVDPAVSAVVGRALDTVVPDCVDAETSPRVGADVVTAMADGQAAPDVWVVDSPMWTSRVVAGGRVGLKALGRAFATTPVLLVGGPRAPEFPTWGDAEASGLVSMSDPSQTAAASLALSAPLAEASAAHRTSQASARLVVPIAQAYAERRARDLDASVSLTTLDEKSTRLQVATEHDLVGATTAQPYLRSSTPPTGAPLVRYQVVVSREAPAEAMEVARGLLSWASSAQGAEVLAADGLRADAAATPEGGAEVRPLPAIPLSTLTHLLDTWRRTSMPSSILAVVDASGSMDFPAGVGTRMQLLARAAQTGVRLLPGHARVGLWVFSSREGGPGDDWTVLQPTERLDKLSGGRTQRYALEERAQELTGLTGGGTGLYDTALAAYRQAIADYRENYSNSVVLLTDGANDDPGSITLPALVARLRELRDPGRPVRILAIGIGPDADLAALRRITGATSGQTYQATEPTDIVRVFADALLNRAS